MIRPGWTSPLWSTWPHPDAAGVRIGQGTVMHRLITHMWAGVKAPAGQGDVLLDGPPCHGFDAHANRAP